MDDFAEARAALVAIAREWADGGRDGAGLGDLVGRLLAKMDEEARGAPQTDVSFSLHMVGFEGASAVLRDAAARHGFSLSDRGSACVCGSSGGWVEVARPDGGVESTV